MTNDISVSEQGLDLLPCAHCASGDTELRVSITDAMVACNNCGCRTGLVYLGADEASNAFRLREVAAVWNTRASQQNSDEQEIG
jgi:hypothetical protein